MMSMKNIFINPNISLTKIDSQTQQVGRHNHISDSEFNSVQLAKGIQVEFEHTDSVSVAKAIAKDHLNEFDDYYIRLAKMEKEAKLAKKATVKK